MAGQKKRVNVYFLFNFNSVKKTGMMYRPTAEYFWHGHRSPVLPAACVTYYAAQVE